MVLVFLTLLIAVVLALLVAGFAAYPHRGEPIPRAERLSEVMMKVNDKLRL